MAAVSPFEAECYLSKFQTIDIENIGDFTWTSQHEWLEKLNIQCHQSAQSKHDEYVVNEILTQNKLSTIIYNLITLETWKQKIFPLIVDKISEQLSLKVYMILYEEATLVTMLQIILYHSTSMEESSCEDGDDTALLELVDYCHRKLVSVVTNKVNVDHFNCHLVEDDPDPSKKLIKQCQHLEFTICSCTVSIIRFITEHLSKAPISVTERVVNTNEMIMTLISLIETAPWTKKTEKGFEKYNGNNKFIPVDRNNRFRLTKIEGELWLSVYNLLLDKTCGDKYELNGFRKNEILKLKRYLTPQIMDQVPILRGLKRTLEELSIMNLNQSSSMKAEKKTLMFVETVPEFREQLLMKNFEQIAKKQLKTTFNASKYDETDRSKDMEVMCRIYNNFEGLEDMLEQPICAKCGQEAEKRCSRCKTEWYCSRECQVKSWKKHKQICDTITQHARKNEKRNNVNDDCKQKAQTGMFIKEVMTKKYK
eukprot:236515_1